MSMTITLKPETELLVRRELDSGRFRTVDEIIVEGVHARHESESTSHPSLLTFGRDKSARAEAGDHIRRARVGNRLPPGVTIRDLIDEGRA